MCHTPALQDLCICPVTADSLITQYAVQRTESDTKGRVGGELVLATWAVWQTCHTTHKSSGLAGSPKISGSAYNTYIHTYAVAYCCIQPPDSRFTASWNKCVPHRSNRILHLRLLRNLHGHYAFSGNAIPPCLRITVITHSLPRPAILCTSAVQVPRAEKEGQ